MEDITGLKSALSSRHNTWLASFDTIARTMKELHEENLPYINNKAMSYKFNKTEKLNRLFLDMLVQCGQIKKGETVDVDFDHGFTPTEKFDTKYSYIKKEDFSLASLQSAILL